MKVIPVVALAPTALTAQAGSAQTENARAGNPQAVKATGPAASAASGSDNLPGYAEKFLISDMDGIGPDGKPTDQKATFTDASKADAKPDAAGKQMALTQEEQDIVNGKQGKEKAKLMKILVVYGNAFGAEKLVDLGGAPHSNMYVGTDYT
ncbi:MAG: DUF521 domain-containing protein [Hyphomicrobium sp.]|nr:DUF521 domain-containing protein [Hyphomicrobium sp.]